MTTRKWDVLEAYAVVGDYMGNQTADGWKLLLSRLAPFMPAPKLVIEVRGGCVTEVRCTDAKALVSLIDWDSEDEAQDAENETQAGKTADWSAVL